MTFLAHLQLLSLLDVLEYSVVRARAFNKLLHHHTRTPRSIVEGLKYIQEECNE